jgi:uncharacterized protein (DUF2236 family)
MAAWVHNVLTESFLAGYQAFGPQKLTEAEADRFVSEQTKVGELLGADPLPRTAAELSSWIVNHPDRAATKHQATAIEFLRKPPLNPPVKLAYRVLFEAAVTTIDPAIRDQLGLTVKTGAENIGSKSISALRWALGSSPDWLAALVRCDEPIPEGAFRQPLRKHHVEALETQSGSLNR